MKLYLRRARVEVDKLDVAPSIMNKESNNKKNSNKNLGVGGIQFRMGILKLIQNNDFHVNRINYFNLKFSRHFSQSCISLFFVL